MPPAQGIWRFACSPPSCAVHERPSARWASFLSVTMIDQVLSFICARGEPAWLVGGFVRDRLLDRMSHDLDVIVPDGGVRLARAVANAFGGAFFVLDDERDVARAVIYAASGEALEVDVARLRAPELVDDLSLRDFTINAMAADITGCKTAAAHDLQIIDPFGGRADLDRRLIRAVTESSFRDDPLRALRAVRQSTELGFRIEDATYSLIRRDAPFLAAVSGERVRDELMRIVSAPGAWQHVRMLARLDLLSPILPEVASLIGVTQSTPHYQDVFDHTRAVLAHLEGLYALLWPDAYHIPQAAPDDAMVIADANQWRESADLLAPYGDDLRAHLLQPLAAGRARRELLFWAALAHDWGKPVMRTADDDGRTRFYDHDRWGAVLVGHRGQALKLSGDEIAYLTRLVDEHMRPTFLAQEELPSRRAIYRFYHDLGDAGPDCTLLSLADSLATRAAQPDVESWRRRVSSTSMLLEAYFRARSEQVAPAPLMNGHQLMAESGLKPGPHVGKLLDDLREAQAVGDVTTLEDARAWLIERIRSM
jgi:tRNA nucleotidyltransferase/poly(A) polymerase